ncbi:TPA: hypothetical protein ACG58T_004839, partial [Escherichia coli]
TVDSIRKALQAYLFLIFIKMLRQLTFLLPTKFQRGKKLRTQRYRGLQSKAKRKLSLLTTKFSDEVMGE